MRQTTGNNQGFSLIQLSVMLAVGAMIMVAVLPGGQVGDDAAKNALTLQRMAKIEEATRAFMVANLRRPCPADGSKPIGDVLFGVEAVNPGNCSNGDGTTTAIANYPPTPGTAWTTGVGGVVPTRTLGLPDEYMFDGYGHRITYMVDRRATHSQSCHDMQSRKTAGGIRILPTFNVSFCPGTNCPQDNVMWALISHGKNGHGAYSMPGNASRINSGATSGDKLTDGLVDSSFAYSYSDMLVKRSPDLATTGNSAFDDVLWYQDSTKNTCCIGAQCSQGFVMVGNAPTSAIPTTRIATGDINGDGYPDLLIANPSYGTTVGIAYVIFGGPTGWPVGGFNTAANQIALSSFTGSNNPIGNVDKTATPIKLTTLNPFTAGNIIYIGGNGTPYGLNNTMFKVGNTSAFFSLLDVYGNPVPNNINGNYAGGSGAMLGHGAVITNDTGGAITSFGKAIAVGDVNGDGYDDVIIGSGSANSGSAYGYITVLLGSPSFSSTTVNSLVLGGYPKGFLVKTQGLNNGYVGTSAIAVGNFSGHADKTKDIMVKYISNGSCSSTNTSGAFIVYGQPANAWPATGTPPSFDSNDGTVFTSAYGFNFISSTDCGFFYGPPGNLWGTGSLSSGDVDKDGIDDILTGKTINTGTITYNAYLIWGRAAAAWTGALASSAGYGCAAPLTCLDMASQIGNATKAVQLTNATDYAGGDFYFGGNVKLADLNGDGYADILVTSTNHIYGLYGGGTWTTPMDMSNLSGGSHFSIDMATNRPTWLSSFGPAGFEVGDVNNDGRPDILVGLRTGAGSAPTLDPYGRNGEGAVLVLMQPNTGWAGTNYTLFDSVTPATSASAWFDSNGAATTNTAGTYYGREFRINGAFSSDNATTPLVMDLNGDSKNDILVGAYHNNGSGAFGGVYTIWGRTQIPWNSSGAPGDGMGIDLNTLQ